jgi:hypothetical protein
MKSKLTHQASSVSWWSWNFHQEKYRQRSLRWDKAFHVISSVDFHPETALPNKIIWACLRYAPPGLWELQSFENWWGSWNWVWSWADLYKNWSLYLLCGRKFSCEESLLWSSSLISKGSDSFAIRRRHPFQLAWRLTNSRYIEHTNFRTRV